MMFGMRVDERQLRKMRRFAELSRKVVVEAGKGIEQSVAEDFVNFFKKKLKADGLGLIPLTRYTILKKRARGDELPRVPFYGKGASDPRSVYNLMRVYLNPKSATAGFHGNAKHHSGLKIKDLLLFHKRGAVKIHLLPRDPFQEAKKRYSPQDVLRRRSREIINAAKSKHF